MLDKENKRYNLIRNGYFTKIIKRPDQLGSQNVITLFSRGCFKVLPYTPRDVCLLGVFRPTQEFSTQMEMSPLLMKGCKF